MTPVNSGLFFPSSEESTFNPLKVGISKPYKYKCFLPLNVVLIVGLWPGTLHAGLQGVSNSDFPTVCGFRHPGDESQAVLSGTKPQVFTRRCKARRDGCVGLGQVSYVKIWKYFRDAARLLLPWRK